jgi:hypothetical protein
MGMGMGMGMVWYGMVWYGKLYLNTLASSTVCWFPRRESNHYVQDATIQ